MRSISSRLMASLVRSYSLVVRGDSRSAIHRPHDLLHMLRYYRAARCTCEAVRDESNPVACQEQSRSRDSGEFVGSVVQQCLKHRRELHQQRLPIVGVLSSRAIWPSL